MRELKNEVLMGAEAIFSSFMHLLEWIAELRLFAVPCQAGW